MGLKKDVRLKSKKKIENLFSTGQRLFHYPLLSLHAPNPLSHHRIAVIVGKKKLRHAHERNIMKRRIREQSRLLIQDFNADTTYDMLLVYQADKVLSSSVIRDSLKLHLLGMEIGFRE